MGQEGWVESDFQFQHDVDWLKAIMYPSEKKTSLVHLLIKTLYGTSSPYTYMFSIAKLPEKTREVLLIFNSQTNMHHESLT